MAKDASPVRKKEMGETDGERERERKRWREREGGGWGWGYLPFTTIKWAG